MRGAEDKDGDVCDNGDDDDEDEDEDAHADENADLDENEDDGIGDDTVQTDHDGAYEVYGDDDSELSDTR